jgi:hypothetical protein
MAAPVTIIRHMHVKPTSTHSDPEFTALWKDVFAWLKSNSVEAQLWQNVSIPQSLVLISGWPSHDFRSKSLDSSKEREYGEKLGKFVDSKNYQELKLDMQTLPLQAPILSIETFNVAAHDTDLFERKALEAQAHVSEKTKAIAAVGGWDVFQEMQQTAPAPPAAGTTFITETAESTAAGTQAGELPQFRIWVSITGWADEEQHVESTKEITGGHLEGPREKVEATKNIYETLHLKKLL